MASNSQSQIPDVIMVGQIALILDPAGPQLPHPMAANSQIPEAVIVGQFLLTLEPDGPIFAGNQVTTAAGPDLHGGHGPLVKADGGLVDPEDFSDWEDEGFDLESLFWEIEEEDEDNANADPDCKWKSKGFVVCLLCKITKKFNKKSLMLQHYGWVHKNTQNQKKSFVCTKCGQTVKEGHKCTVPKGYQFN